MRPGCRCCGGRTVDDCYCEGSFRLCGCCDHHCQCDTFKCGQCGAYRFNPPAGSDDYECDEGHWRPCGAPLCEDCMRKQQEPQYARYISDGGAA